MDQTKDIDAAIDCMAYGYQIKVLVNGKDLNMAGGGSAAVRLFSEEHSMKAEAAPEIVERLFILKPGENTLRVEYNKNGDETSRLTLNLQLSGHEEGPVLTLETADASGVFEKTFTV